MRSAFINTLVDLAETDERIFLLTGDLGFSFLEIFQEKFPRRFFNMGVAEQDMIGAAAGLALSGKIVFVYSIVPFITLRCLEQIRNDLCFQNLNVRLVGVGGGVTYGSAGSTHYGLEDFGVLRSLPNMTIVAPGDVKETEGAVRASISHQGPIYLRIGRAKKVIHSDFFFKIGKGIVLKEGKDLTIIAAGSMLSLAFEVSQALEKNGLSVFLISMPTIKPLDEKIILKAARKTKAIFTVEEHSIIGGLGTAVGEVLCSSNYKIFFEKFGFPDELFKSVGSQEYLLKKNKLTAEDLVTHILKLRKEKII